MISNSSVLSSVFKGTCPRCHSDPMYVNPNPYILTETMKMHDHCSGCGLKYKVEPNFFFGAMYVSYGLAVFAGLLIFLACYFIFKTGLADAFIAIFIGLTALMPAITRLSRNIYIAMFVHYRPELDKTHRG